VTELKYKSLYENQEFDICLIKFVQCTGAPSGGAPQKRCSAVHIQLAGKFIIASGLFWELLTFSSISSQAGWEILTFPLAFQAEQKELAEGTLETDDD